jgi:hypothetical protein
MSAMAALFRLSCPAYALLNPCFQSILPAALPIFTSRSAFPVHQLIVNIVVLVFSSPDITRQQWRIIRLYDRTTCVPEASGWPRDRDAKKGSG